MLQNRLLRIAAGGACLLFCGFVVAAVTLGSADRVVPYLQGRRLLVEPLVLSINEDDDEKIIPATLTNIGTREITIISANSSCSCLTVEQMPLSIPSGESTTLHVKYRKSALSAKGQLTLTLVTDHPDQPLVPLVLERRP